MTPLKTYQEIDAAAKPFYAKLEQRGVPINLDKARQVQADLKRPYDAKLEELRVTYGNPQPHPK